MRKSTYAYIALAALIGAAAIWANSQPHPGPPAATEQPVATTTEVSTTAPAVALPPEKRAAGTTSEEAKIVATPPAPAPAPQKQTVVGTTINASNIIALTNNARISAGLKPLRESQKLDQSAALKTDEMVSQHIFKHDFTPGGALDTTQTFGKVGYAYIGAGENLGVTYTDVPSTWTVQDMETEFEQSPEHEKNIMSAAYTEIGVSVAQGTYQDRPVTFVAVHFGTPK